MHTYSHEARDFGAVYTGLKAGKRISCLNFGHRKGMQLARRVCEPSQKGEMQNDLACALTVKCFIHVEYRPFAGDATCNCSISDGATNIYTVQTRITAFLDNQSQVSANASQAGEHIPSSLAYTAIDVTFQL